MERVRAQARKAAAEGGFAQQVGLRHVPVGGFNLQVRQRERLGGDLRLQAHGKAEAHERADEPFVPPEAAPVDPALARKPFRRAR
jgi:hypothetical protein